MFYQFLFPLLLFMIIMYPMLVAVLTFVIGISVYIYRIIKKENEEEK